MVGTCLYEVLGVDRTATTEEIRSAYKRLALQWHPDKNPEDMEGATRRFRELQHAYSVLSDVHERAWYDGHRESILRGRDVNSDDEEDNQDHGVNVYPFFSASCFNGYGDDADGFYAVYSRVFTTIEEEEEEASTSDQQGNREPAPAFGRSDALYKDVQMFYTYWEHFISRKLFRWADRWNLAEAPNRQIRRAMEKENKKRRDKARKAFIDVVRELVYYVQKRDPRVARRRAEVIREKQEKERLRAAQKERDAVEAQQQAEELRTLQAEHWREVEEELRALDELDGVEEEEEEEELKEHYCVACHKRFKSEKQWLNHEKSKKHREAVERLRASLIEEDGFVGEEEEEEEEDEDEDDDDDEDEGEQVEEEQVEKEEQAEDEQVLVVEHVEEKEPQTETMVDKVPIQRQKKERRRRKDNKTDESGRAERKQATTILYCLVCKEEFASRNTLFQHIKSTGHAALKDETRRQRRR